MEAVCGREEASCEAHALAAALHSLHLYCATISAALMCCCTPKHKRHRCIKHWRWQNLRGAASLVLCGVWCCGAAAATLRPADTVQLVAALMAPLAWLAAAAFHVALWTRRSTAPILYLAIYWLLAAASSASILYRHLLEPAASAFHIQLYLQGLSTLLALFISIVDSLCFYDEVKSETCNKEKLLLNKCQRNLRKICNLQKRIRKLKKQQILEAVLNDKAVQELSANLTNSFAVLLQGQLLNCKRKKQGRRWNLTQKIISLRLYKRSPACYRLLRRLFSLPSQTTLKNLLNRLPLKPGINQHLFDVIKKMADNNTPEDNEYCLLFDEMSIRKTLNYNKKSDQIDGFQDHGEEQGRDPQVASHALVFMITGIRKKIKQPVAYYLSGDHVTADRLTVLIKEIIKSYENNRKSPTESRNIVYKYNDAHFYSKITFYWLNPFLYKGYNAPLEDSDFGDIPENEQSCGDYKKFSRIYFNSEEEKTNLDGPSIWRCYTQNIWPNFYLAGVLKLCGDLIGVVPPLGLAVIIQYVSSPGVKNDNGPHVTMDEFFNNGYIMLFIVTLALISQAILSQNSTHLVTVEGMRLKSALQAMIYNKCMRLAPWSTTQTNLEEESPLLQSPEDTAATRSGLLTNLIAQDTYNIMSCVWICHYLWAIPLKIAVVLYLLHKKLGVSAIIGTAAAVFLITPLQFFIGKKLSDNSKDISKCTDHRISKMTEILQGMTVIKLYVWEDLFKEKILQLRELELRLLNKDSIYWSFLTFTTQVSTILITVITFTAYYFIEPGNGLTAVNVFAGLAFFNQLTIPLLILPVTVLMVVQALVSTRRIRDFLDLPEANNVTEKDDSQNKAPDKLNDAFIEHSPLDEVSFWDKDDDNKEISNDDEINDQFSDDEVFELVNKSEYMVRFSNAAFTWGTKNDCLLEVEDLDIPTGKLIMVVGSTGSGKSSFLSAILGEMFTERGELIFNGSCPTWYAGQPPWLLEGSVRDNIVMDHPWCQQRYTRVLRATGLRPDLQLLPDGDATHLGSQGAPLSGGQRIRVCVARALYSSARLIALDEPLGALDAALARHVVARGLLPAARAGRTVILATNRLELMHYSDMIVVMEDGRVAGYGRASADGSGVLSRWAQLGNEARAAAARAGAGPPGGTARERTRLVRALTRASVQRCSSDDTMLGINEATGSHLLAEVATCASGTWRRATLRPRPALSRQLSSPPALVTNSKWTPRTLRRLISSESDSQAEDIPAQNVTDENAVESAYSSLTTNGGGANPPAVADQPAKVKDVSSDISEWSIWCSYARACGWCGAAYWALAGAAQALAVAADCWLSALTAATHDEPLTQQQTWGGIRMYAIWCVCGAVAAGAAQAAGAAAGARARRTLHERLLHAALHAPLPHYHATPPGYTLHRFSADILVIDKKLPTAISRWAQLALLCAAAMLVNAVVAPWSILALLPALLSYVILQAVYLCNARELQRAEASSAGGVVSLCTETYAGAATVRAGRLQPRMRAEFMRRLDVNHNALLLLNSANRWLGLSLDLVGAVSVCVTMGVALCGGSAARAGLAGAYSLLLPAYLAHLAKCRADLDSQLAALERVHLDTNIPQEDYREEHAIPPGWQRNGKTEFENVSIQHEAGSPPILTNVTLTVSPGEKLAVCGRSGSGKSTLLMSCVGATAISSGRILLDGEDVTKVPLRALRHRVVVLPQEPTMFSGTLRENLDPLAVHTDEEIWHSLRAVGLCDFVTAQPAGLECSVERSRCGWSVGRVARLCAARAALHARLASALLLDEPAAALDGPAERALLAALAAAAPRLTLLTVAHRVSSVRGYDRAVVLEAGRAAEQGAVTSLLAQPASRLARMLATAHRLH